MKKCNKCLVEKPFSGYSKDKYKKDGLSTICKDCRTVYVKEYYKQNREKIRHDTKKYYNDNIEEGRRKRREYHKRNEEDRKKKRKELYHRNRAENIKKSSDYHLKRMSEDPLYRFKARCRTRIYQSFVNKGFTKKSSTFKMLGCTYEEFVEHITSQFTEGMTLENYGEWHLDHILPINAATTVEDVVKLNHYTNFQPLWASDNISKSDKHDEARLAEVLGK